METRSQERIQHLLAAHGILVGPSSLEEGVTRFQEQGGLLVDGIIGPATLWALQQNLLGSQLKLERCPADKLPGIDGFDNLTLRADVALAYQKLYDEAKSLGGNVTTAGGIRRLTSGANSNRSVLSHHYWAGAFDLSLVSGFFAPQRDPFVIEKRGDRHWTVWMRADGGQDVTLNAIHWDSWNSGRDRFQKVEGKFVNFTELCEKHGFSNIGARVGFTRSSNRQYGSAEWWHFQYERALFPEVSQIGIELLRIDSYTEARIRRDNPGLWAQARTVFKRGWA